MHKRNVDLRFDPKVRFGVTSSQPAWSQSSVSALEQLKERMLGEKLRECLDSSVHLCLRRAAEEAASLAWITPWPLLILPVLLAEKFDQANRQAQRQREIRNRSRAIMVLAA